MKAVRVILVIIAAMVAVVASILILPLLLLCVGVKIITGMASKIN